MPKRLLAIDDDRRYLEDFKSWIPPSLAEQHSAQTTVQAVTLLRRYYYHLVFLDLSMDETSWDRSNRGIQNYLSTRPDGTLYIIISGTAKRAEIRDAAFSMGAFDVIFKTELTTDLIREKVERAFDLESNSHSRFVADTRKKLIGNASLEANILARLKTKGISSLNKVLEALSGRIAPIAQNLHRPELAVCESSVVGLVWSRQLGQAISLSLANVDISPESSQKQLADWLGYSERSLVIPEKVYHRKVRVQCFTEPNIPDNRFDLPMIVT